MREILLIPILSVGAALVWYGLKQTSEDPKVLATVNVAPEDRPLIPVTSYSDNGNQATFAQLLTAYKEEKRKWQSLRDAAFDRMQRVMQQASQVCREFAWNATWSYKYDGLFDMFSGKTILSKEQPESLKISCLSYVKGEVSSPGTPSVRKPPTDGANFIDDSWLDVAKEIRLLQQQIKDAQALLPNLRERYLAAKAEYDAAQQHVGEMERKIADLHAQEVF